MLLFLKSSKKSLFSVSIILLLLITSGCGSLAYKRSDVKDNPVNAKERAKKNVAEGRSFSLSNIGKNKGGAYQFASSNPLWRASLEIINFMPLSNADYSGGLIITDWYNQSGVKNESIKITIRFLSNEIRSDGLKIIIHKKICDNNMNCSVNLLESDLSNDIKIAILKKASKFKANDKVKRKDKNDDFTLRR